MAFINQATTMNVKAELDIFKTHPVQTAIEGGTVNTYRPLTSISNATGPIEFVVSGSSNDEYIDLARVYLNVKARVTIEAPVVNGVAGAVPVVGPVNNWLHSMFSQVDVYLNQKCITPPANNYGFRAYIENLLNYSSEAKRSHLSTGCWADDTAGHMDAITAANAGFTTRRELTVDNRTVDLYGPLHCDLFNVDTYLLNGVEMTVKLQRARPDFHLMGGVATGTFEILEAELYVRKVKISSSVLLAHHKALNVATAKYPITRVDVKTITIPAGTQSRVLDNVYLGNLPKR